MLRGDGLRLFNEGRTGQKHHHQFHILLAANFSQPPIMAADKSIAGPRRAKESFRRRQQNAAGGRGKGVSPAAAMRCLLR